MKEGTKLKTASLVVLSALCISAASLGFAAGANVQDASAEGETVVSTWKNVGTMNDAGVTVANKSFVGYNTTNILEAPDRTISFNAYFDGFDGWSGMTLVNGLSNCSRYSWPLGASHSTTDFPMNSIIFQHNSAQYYRSDGNPAAIGVTTGASISWSKQMIGISIHIGTGEAAEEGGEVDYSWIAYSNTMLKSSDGTATAGQNTSLLYDLTTANFPNGCYYAVHFNAMAGGVAYLTEPGSTYTVQSSSKPGTAETIKFRKNTADVTFRTRSFLDTKLGENFDQYEYVVKVNGHTLASDEYTLTPQTTSAKAYIETTINKDWFNNPDNEQYLDTTSFVTLEVYKKATETEPRQLYGTGNAALSVLFEEPPVLVTEPEIIADGIQDVEVLFDYDGTTEINAETVRIYGAVRAKDIDKTNPLTADDYTVTRAEPDESGRVINTITIQKEYLAKVCETYRTQLFVIEFGTHSLETTVWIAPETDGWIYRSVDYVKDTLVQDEYYSTAEMNKFAEATLSTRLFNSTAIDVTKPIVIEFGEVPYDCEWTYFGIFDTPTVSDSFTESADAQLAMIFFGSGRNDFQKMKGIVGGSSSNLSYPQVTMKNNTLEVYFHPETASEGWLKINGEKIATPEKTQAAFADGKAYVGFFFNANKGKTIPFTVNTNINPVVIETPDKDGAYAMDLAKAEDFVLKLSNTSGNLTLKDETGAEIPAAQFAYDAEAGTLTVKAAYFTNKVFTKSGTVYLYDTVNKTGTSFRMAYSSSNMNGASIGYATLGALADVKIPLADVTTVNGVLAGEEMLENGLWSFENGTLTVKAAALKNEKGTQEFIAISGSQLYPCYAIVRAWNDKGVSSAGLGSVKSVDNTHKITGKIAADIAKLYNLNEGYTFAIDFNTVDAYYENSRNAEATSVTLKFYDPYTGYTLSVTLYANFADEEVSSTNNALYVRYGITNAEGGIVLAPVQRGVNIASNENNTSAKGLQSLQISAADGALSLNVCGRSLDISDLKGFRTGACMLSIDTNSATAASVVTVTAFEGKDVNVYEQNIPDPEIPENPGNPDDPEVPEKPAKKGCGSAVGFVSAFAAASALAIAATAVAVTKKSKKNDGE